MRETKDDKRNKRLAEWLELDITHKFEPVGVNDIRACTKCGAPKPPVFEYCGLPDFLHSLDTCFKHLVPKALAMLLKEGYVPPVMKLFQLWYDELVSLTGDSSNVQQAALALCKAIEKQFGLEGGS